MLWFTSVDHVKLVTSSTKANRFIPDAGNQGIDQCLLLPRCNAGKNRMRSATWTCRFWDVPRGQQWPCVCLSGWTDIYQCIPISGSFLPLIIEDRIAAAYHWRYWGSYSSLITVIGDGPLHQPPFRMVTWWLEMYVQTGGTGLESCRRRMRLMVRPIQTDVIALVYLFRLWTPRDLTRLWRTTAEMPMVP